MPFGVPVTPSEVVKNAATNVVSSHISRGISELNAGNNLNAAQAFAQATAVSAAYAVGTLVGFSYYPIRGLSQALQNLAG